MQGCYSFFFIVITKICGIEAFIKVLTGVNHYRYTIFMVVRIWICIDKIVEIMYSLTISKNERIIYQGFCPAVNKSGWL